MRSLAASASTLGKPHVNLLSLVDRANLLTRHAPYAVIGGVAQVLWARKTHTDDLDVAIASDAWRRAVERVRRKNAPRGWRLGENGVESDDVFEVAHATYRGSVVDFLYFRDDAFMREVLSTAQVVAAVGPYRFIRPELLLVTHLLRPRVEAALAAVELVIARRAAGDFDEAYADRWAKHMGRAAEFARALARAADLQSGERT